MSNLEKKSIIGSALRQLDDHTSEIKKREE